MPNEKKTETTISSAQINPFVRFAGFRQGMNGMRNGISYAKDCRLFYFTAGTCEFLIGKNLYQTVPGEVYLIPPMCPYQMLRENGAECYLVNFDYLMLDCEIECSIPVTADESEEPHQRVRFLDLQQLNGVVALKVSGISKLLAEMSELYRRKSIYFRAEMNSRFTQVLLRVFEQLLVGRPTGGFAEMAEYVSEHCAEALTNQRIGERFHYHPNYVNRSFVLHTGKSLHQYLLACRVEKAILLLQTTNASVSEIAVQTGWKNQSQFSRGFRQVTGYPPSSFRSGK